MAGCGEQTPVAGPSPSVSIGAEEKESPAGKKEVWEGTWEDQHRNPTVGVASRSEGTVILIVAPDGSVSGEASATQTTEGGSADFTIKFTGTRDDEAFRLGGTGPGGTLHMVVPIDGTAATGKGQRGSGGNLYIWEMAVDCINCEA